MPADQWWLCHMSKIEQTGTEHTAKACVKADAADAAAASPEKSSQRIPIRRVGMHSTSCPYGSSPPCASSYGERKVGGGSRSGRRARPAQALRLQPQHSIQPSQHRARSIHYPSAFAAKCAHARFLLVPSLCCIEHKALEKLCRARPTWRIVHV